MKPIRIPWRMLAMTAAISAQHAQAQTLVVLNKTDDNVSFIAPATGDVFATIAVGEDPHEAATSPDGKTIVVCNYGPRERPGNTLTVIDLPSKKATQTIDLGENRRPHGIVYLNDTTITVTSEVAKKLLIVDIEAGKVTATINTDQDTSHMVAVTPDQRLAFVANIRSGSTSIIDLQAKKARR